MTREEAIAILVREIDEDIFVRTEYRKQIHEALNMGIEALEQESIGHCKDCKHWKDSDGIYRRDINAESKCPMNCKEVYEGTGYCFLFEPNEESEIEK